MCTLPLEHKQPLGFLCGQLGVLIAGPACGVLHRPERRYLSSAANHASRTKSSAKSFLESGTLVACECTHTSASVVASWQLLVPWARTVSSATQSVMLRSSPCVQAHTNECSFHMPTIGQAPTSCPFPPQTMHVSPAPMHRFLLQSRKTIHSPPSPRNKDSHGTNDFGPGVCRRPRYRVGGLGARASIAIRLSQV